ncbi:hypothetical protein PC111_g22516 [Phytophthora cactorum]|nr:hypothetical protein PC111_g22516 [Phytophthora cactorum]KAG2992969.1 hypothetical protein PC120_g22354 [Phytophthora cactorum]
MTHATRNVRSVIDKPAFKRLTRQQKETLRKQRYLLRLKNERETLKRTEHELTSRLTQLQQETEIKKRRTVNNQVIRRSSWRDFALLQRGQLHHPKEEHKKLVSAVNIQSRYFKTLSELVPEPLLRSAIIKQITSMSVLSSLHTNNLTNRFEFAEQLRQTQDDGGPEYYQHFNMFTQPFHLNRTQQTWWKLASFDGMITDREDYADLADPDQAAILRLRLIRTLATGLTVSIIQRYIFHRIVGESRTIFTWKTLSEGEGIFSGMSLKENGWACLQESVEDESTVVGVCDQQVPRRFGDSSPHQKNSQEFCELMHNMLNDNARMITATLSELLIKETLADIDILPRSSLAPCSHDGHRCIDSRGTELAHFLSQDTDSGADSVKYETQAPKPKTRAEKEVIRKRKYHHRLRNERESLRQLFGELSVQLQDLRLSKGLYTISAEDSVALVNSRNWKDVALLRRQLRHRSETEQVQLFTAARLQAMYIDKLRAQLPGNSTCLLVFR